MFLAELKELTLRNIDIEEALVALSTYLLQVKQLESLRLDTVIYRREIQVSDLGFAIFKQALESLNLLQETVAQDTGVGQCWCKHRAFFCRVSRSQQQYSTIRMAFR